MINGKLDKYVRDALFYNDLAGLAIGVRVGENSPLPYSGLNYEGTAGFKDFIKKEPLSPDDIFHVASVTKLFVGTSIMLLKEQGKLDLDSKIKEILPWLYIDDERYSDITVRNLLTHTAGLTDVSDYEWDRPQLDEGALKRYVQSDEVAKSKLLWAPGENSFRYSNIGYEILGTVIAEISGVSFEEFVRANLLEPLGMKNTTLLTFERTKALGIEGELTDSNYIKESLALENLSKVNMAMPHTKDAEKHIIFEPCYPYNRAHGPSSTVTTNLKDLSKWAEGHLKKKILKEETYDEVWNKYTTVPNNGEEMGISWFMREQNGYKLYGHEGNDDGFRASFWICPELELHIAVLCNSSKAPVKRIGKNVFDILCGTEQ